VIRNPRWHERLLAGPAFASRRAAAGGMNAPIVSLLVCGLGGEGGGVLSEWLSAWRAPAARGAGHLDPGRRAAHRRDHLLRRDLQPARRAAGRPHAGVLPQPGAGRDRPAGVVELLETARQIGMGMATAERTTVLSSNAR
jgi:indolepyruvate ferredoxin oxidoreductase beta subunit